VSLGKHNSRSQRRCIAVRGYVSV